MTTVQNIRKLVSDKTISEFTKLGIYQVSGGAIGFVLTIFAIAKSSSFNYGAIPFYVLIIAFFSYSILCGTFCFRITRNALSHSLVNQIGQLVSFSLLGLTYQYASGVYFILGIDLSEKITLDFGAGLSSINLGYNSLIHHTEISVNMVALVLVIWVDRLKKIVIDEIQIRTIKTIGENQDMASDKGFSRG